MSDPIAEFVDAVADRFFDRVIERLTTQEEEEIPNLQEEEEFSEEEELSEEEALPVSPSPSPFPYPTQVCTSKRDVLRVFKSSVCTSL
ncbi:hypothetical protein GEMRC1_000450 [Eukaryota sp. GEM-RC1]